MQYVKPATSAQLSGGADATILPSTRVAVVEKSGAPAGSQQKYRVVIAPRTTPLRIVPPASEDFSIVSESTLNGQATMSAGKRENVGAVYTAGGIDFTTGFVQVNATGDSKHLTWGIVASDGTPLSAAGYTDLGSLTDAGDDVADVLLTDDNGE